MTNSLHGKLIAAFLIVVCCSFSAASTNDNEFIREVPHSERSEAIFLYYQKYKPESTANPFNGTQQEHRA